MIFKCQHLKRCSCSKPPSASRRGGGGGGSNTFLHLKLEEEENKKKRREKSGLLQGHGAVREGHAEECNSYLEFKMR